MLCRVNDRASYQITQREYTDEGFLKVPGRVARTGIQEYLARELGLDGDPGRVIRVYRAPEEVFCPRSLSTYDAVDVTNNHPGELVNAENYREVTVGMVRGPGRQDGEYVVADLFIKDKATIDQVNSGKVELSAGYTAIYEDRPGVTADGESYDFVQREIRINHVAVVDRARAGANARVFDHTPEKSHMLHKITLDSGRTVEVQDAATATLIADTMDRLNAKVEAAEARADKAQATADSLTERLEEAKKASSPEAVAAQVQAIASTSQAARKVAGDGFTCDSVDPVEIKRAALAVARPKVEWPSKSAAYVEAAFDAEMEREEEEEEEEESEESRDKKAVDSLPDALAQLVRLAQDGATIGGKVKDAASELTPYQRHKQSLASQHKTVHSVAGE